MNKFLAMTFIFLSIAQNALAETKHRKSFVLDISNEKDVRSDELVDFFGSNLKQSFKVDKTSFSYNFWENFFHNAILAKTKNDIVVGVKYKSSNKYTELNTIIPYFKGKEIAYLDTKFYVNSIVNSDEIILDVKSGFSDWIKMGLKAKFIIKKEKDAIVYESLIVKITSKTPTTLNFDYDVVVLGNINKKSIDTQLERFTDSFKIELTNIINNNF